jgi:molybdenum cofactor cytidylyltransferase
MIAAVILSAGESSRMGSPKALLPIEGKTFVERIVSTLQQTKVGKIIVVLGHNAEEMKQKIGHLAVTVVVNRDYAKGQLSSLIAALRSLETEEVAGEVDGLLVHLVDLPFLNPSLVDAMIDSFYSSNKLIVVPLHKGRRGHPVIFSRKLFPEILSAPLDQGAKAVTRAHRDETLELETDDGNVLVDIDTPQDYAEHVGRKIG